MDIFFGEAAARVNATVEMRVAILPPQNGSRWQ
jgi:hypothetical protein